MRPLGILTTTDRVMQTPYKFPPESVAETYADPNSYRPRIDRSTHDAIEQCFTDLNKGKFLEWTLGGGIKGYLDHISHGWLLENIPMDTQIFEKWLKCGYVEARKSFPTDESVPQGGTIFPTLMNVTLDGLERLFQERLLTQQKVDGRTHFNKLNFACYAGDSIITGESSGFLRDEVLPIVKEFLTERELQLSEEKTAITHIEDGLDFLGKSIRKYNGKLFIKPSKASVKSLLEEVRSITKGNKSTKQETLIRKLNPVIRGWVDNQRCVASSKVFSGADYEIYRCLWQWAERRHKKKSHKWIAQKYWHHIGSRQRTFSVPYENQSTEGEPLCYKLEYAADTKIIRFKKVVAGTNPLDECWTDYSEKREGEKLLNSTKGREKLLTIRRRQHRRCPVCGDFITSETDFKVHTPAGKNSPKTMVHKECHEEIHSLITTFESGSR